MTDMSARCTRWSPLEQLSITVAATAADARLHGMPSLGGDLEILSVHLQQQALDADEQIDGGLSAEHAHAEGLAHACRSMVATPPPAPTMTATRFLVVVVVGALAAVGLLDLAGHILP